MSSSGWRQVDDPTTGRLYWYNDKTEESSWEAPAHLQPGAPHEVEMHD